MKIILHIVFILICSFDLIGQTGDSQAMTLKQNDSLGVQIVKAGDTSKTDYFLIFNETDSILFNSMNCSFHTTTLGFDGITIDEPQQLDQIGQKEIILYHVYNNMDKFGGQNKAMYIINPDTKKVMFSGKYYHNNSYNEHKTYSYKVSFDTNENLIINYNISQSNMDPDVKEGMYSLVNGIYTWKKSQYQYTRNVLAQKEDYGIEVVRIGSCERHLNRYYVANGEDSVIFRYTDRCLEQDPLEYQESVKLDSKQLDKKGQDELILEYEYSGNQTYTGYHKEVIIINLDSMEIIFRKEIEARGQHFYGEELGDHYGFKYEISYTDEGEIIINKPANNLHPALQEIYTLVGNKYGKKIKGANKT